MVATMQLRTQEMEKLVLEYLRIAGKPIKAKELALRLGTNERMVRRLVRDLIAQGNLIASSMEAPYGYFIPQDEKAIQRYSRQLKSRIREIAGRLTDFDRSTASKIQQVLFASDNG